MKTKIIMVRHGETEWNVSCRFLGSVDLPLNEKGRRQAGYARVALKDENIDVCWSSPMKRAYETAEIICEGREIEIRTEEGLREINCGKWEGRNGKEVEEIYPGEIALWGNSPADVWIDGGETFMEVSSRIVDTFWKIVRANRGKTILITSHMICLTLLLLNFDDKCINEMWNVKPIGNAALNIVEVSDDNKVDIVAWSDDSFVPEEDKKGSALVAGRNCAEKKTEPEISDSDSKYDAYLEKSNFQTRSMNGYNDAQLRKIQDLRQ